MIRNERSCHHEESTALPRLLERPPGANSSCIRVNLDAMASAPYLMPSRRRFIPPTRTPRRPFLTMQASAPEHGSCSALAWPRLRGQRLGGLRGAGHRPPSTIPRRSQDQLQWNWATPAPPPPRRSSRRRKSMRAAQVHRARTGLQHRRRGSESHRLATSKGKPNHARSGAFYEAGAHAQQPAAESRSWKAAITLRRKAVGL